MYASYGRTYSYRQYWISGIFHIGDVFAIRPISYSRAFAGAGSFNVGDNVSVYNYQSATTVNDSDVVDRAIIGST